MRILINGKKARLKKDAENKDLRRTTVDDIKKAENIIDIEGIENAVVRCNGEACFYVENSIVKFYKQKLPSSSDVISATKDLGGPNLGGSFDDFNFGVSNISAGLGESHLGNP